MAVRAFRGAFRKHTLPDPGLFEETVILIPTIKNDGTRDPNITAYGRVDTIDAGSQDYKVVQEFYTVTGGSDTVSFDAADVNYFRKVTFIFRGYDPYKYQMVYLPNFTWNYNWDVIGHEQPMGPGSDYHTVYLRMSFADPENAEDSWTGGEIKENYLVEQVQPVIPPAAEIPVAPTQPEPMPPDTVVVSDEPPAEPPAEPMDGTGQPAEPTAPVEPPTTVVVPSNPPPPDPVAPIVVAPSAPPAVPTQPPAAPVVPPATAPANPPDAVVPPTSPTSPAPPTNANIRPSWANAIPANLPGLPANSTQHIWIVDMTKKSVPPYEDPTYTRGNKWIGRRSTFQRNIYAERTHNNYAFYDYDPYVEGDNHVLPDPDTIYFYHEMLTKPNWVSEANEISLGNGFVYGQNRTPWNNSVHDVRFTIALKPLAERENGQALVDNLQELVEVMRVYHPGSLWTNTGVYAHFEFHPFGNFESSYDFPQTIRDGSGLFIPYSVYNHNNGTIPAPELEEATIAVPAGLQKPGQQFGAQYADPYAGWVVRQPTATTELGYNHAPDYEWQGTHNKDTEGPWTYWNYDPFLNPLSANTHFEIVGGVQYDYNIDDTAPYWVARVPQTQYPTVPNRGTLGTNAFNYNNFVFFLFDPQFSDDQQDQSTASITLYPPNDRPLTTPGDEGVTTFYIYSEVAHLTGFTADTRQDVQNLANSGWAFYSAPRQPITGVPHVWRVAVPQVGTLPTIVQDLVEIMQLHHPGARMTPHSNTYYFEYNPLGNFATIDQLPEDGGHPPTSPEEPAAIADTGFWYEVFNDVGNNTDNLTVSIFDETPEEIRTQLISGTDNGEGLLFVPQGRPVPGQNWLYRFRVDRNANFLTRIGSNPSIFVSDMENWLRIMRIHHPHANYHEGYFEGEDNSFSYFQFNPFGNFGQPSDLANIAVADLVLPQEVPGLPAAPDVVPPPIVTPTSPQIYDAITNRYPTVTPSYLEDNENHGSTFFDPPHNVQSFGRTIGTARFRLSSTLSGLALTLYRNRSQSEVNQYLTDTMHLYHPNAKFLGHQSGWYYWEENPIGNFDTIAELIAAAPIVPEGADLPAENTLYQEIQTEFPSITRDSLIASTFTGGAGNLAIGLALFNTNGQTSSGVPFSWRTRFPVNTNTSANNAMVIPNDQTSTDRFAEIMRRYYPDAGYRRTASGYAYYEYNPFGNFTEPENLTVDDSGGGGGTTQPASGHFYPRFFSSGTSSYWITSDSPSAVRDALVAAGSGSNFTINHNSTTIQVNFRDTTTPVYNFLTPQQQAGTTNFDVKMYMITSNGDVHTRLANLKSQLGLSGDIYRAGDITFMSYNTMGTFETIAAIQDVASDDLLLDE